MSDTSPRRKREYSFSSLSSGSFGDAHTSSSRKLRTKSSRDRNTDNRRHDTRSPRRERRGYSKVPRHEKIREQNKEKRSKNSHYESPEEESYLKPMSHREDNLRTSISEKGIHPVAPYETEESMRDPSTCNFRGTVHMTEDEVITPITHGTVKILEERRNIKDETSDRIERLEKLVELLVNNKKVQTNPTNISEENIWPSNVNIYELIPRNTNFTTSMWLNKIQEECIEKNLDERTSIQFMQSKMSGVIKAWFKTIPSYDFTWPELKMLIIETFPDNIDFAYTLRVLVERKKKPDETITQYYFSKAYLLEACKISGANAVSCLIDGLDNEFWKQEARSHNYLTPEALYSQLLSKYINYDYGQYQAPEQTVEVYNYPTDQTENRVYPKFTNKKFMKNKRCLTCNKLGHFTTDCRHAPLCYRCKNEGHIAVNCPLKKTNI